MAEGKQDLQKRRRSIRLKCYDYAGPGAYFVTICATDRKCSFGEILSDAMRSNACGDIVTGCWNEIPIHFPNVRLDAFVLMPNHVHGILIIQHDDTPDRRGTTCRAPTHANTTYSTPTIDQKGSTSQRFSAPTPQSLPTIVRSFKAAVTKRVRELTGKTELEVWQRNYYEHVIHNEDSLSEIRRYIEENPLRWALDRENPANIQGNRVHA
jgi:putative transposase